MIETMYTVQESSANLPNPIKTILVTLSVKSAVVLALLASNSSFRFEFCIVYHRNSSRVRYIFIPGKLVYGTPALFLKYGSECELVQM